MSNTKIKILTKLESMMFGPYAHKALQLYKEIINKDIEEFNKNTNGEKMPILQRRFEWIVEHWQTK